MCALYTPNVLAEWLRWVGAWRPSEDVPHG